VDGFVEKGNNLVPRVKTKCNSGDYLGTLRVRLGIARNAYKVNPGLYCVGNPFEDSPVLVTANYKLSFDTLRSNLQGTDAWILVVDTRGINVWCAAGKGTFSADEICLQVKRAHLDKVVSHRELILPQCAAAGVASHELKNKCGFKGIYGPIRAQDLPQFLTSQNQADERMRSVNFSLGERLVLTPVELVLTWKFILVITVIAFVISGIGPGIYLHQTKAVIVDCNACMECGACATNCPTEAIFVNPDEGCGCAALIINRWISRIRAKPLSDCGC
jgi:NAD-dependent dihydropyrimidine dehydrogenase PreA subunit